jgi:hypothetical protein
MALESGHCFWVLRVWEKSVLLRKPRSQNRDLGHPERWQDVPANSW